MCKKFVSLVILVLLWQLASTASAQDFIGGNPAPNAGSWCTPSNWSNGVVPADSSTSTGIYVMPGATIGVGCNAVCHDVHLAIYNGQTGGLTIDGGSLTIADFWVLGYFGGATGNFVMNSGSAKCYRVYIGHIGGTGTWNQYGGTFETQQLWVGTSDGAKGTVNLYGGTIFVQPVQFFELASAEGTTALMNIAGGTLVLMGDYVGTIKRYISQGNIVAYGGNPGAALKFDYNISSRGKTTLYAVMMDPSLAHNANPFHLGKLGLLQQNITWDPGNHANRHNLYFGSSADDLQEISHGQEPNSYSVSSLNVQPGHTYFWRVDEVNDSNGHVWPGDVWQFNVAEYITVDDMTSYNQSSNKITSTWVGGGSSGSVISLETDYNHCHYLVGQAMQFDYKNDGSPYMISKVYAPVSKLKAGANWAAGNVEILTLWFQGDPNNAADQLYVKLADTTAHSAVQIYGDFNDLDGTISEPNANAIKDGRWHEWNIDLSRFTGVNLNSVLTMTIGVGKQTPAVGGKGTIYIDDIRLYPEKCLLRGGSSIGDINGDCIVDLDDFIEFVDGWLDSGQLL